MTACVYTPFVWKHPTASMSQREDDWRTCDGQAQGEAYTAANQTNVEAKRIAGKWDGHTAMGMHVADIESVRSKFFAKCMEAKGYNR